MAIRRLVEIKQQVPALYLTWILNNICTNQCSYCPDIVHNGTNHHYDWEMAEKFVTAILDKYPNVHLAISGGEPTLSPWLIPLVKMFYDNGNSVGITTNGARTSRYFDELSKYLSYIVISYHPSFENPELLERALVCAKHTTTTVQIMLDSRYFDKAVDAYQQFKQHPSLHVEVMRVVPWTPGNYVGCEYTKEQLAIINTLPRVYGDGVEPKYPGILGGQFIYDDGTSESKASAQKLINEGKDNFQGWTCNIGLESLLVRFDGIIKTSNCESANIIGRIQDLENLQWPTSAMICPQNTCHCTTDVYVGKKAP